MDIVTIVLGLLLAIIILIMICSNPEKRKIKHYLDKLPGPPAYPVFGNALEFLTTPMHRYVDIYAEHNKYGPIFRTLIGNPGEVCINGAEEAEVILSNINYIDKSDEYMALKTCFGENLFLRQGQRWRTLRKMLTLYFSSTILDSYLDIFNQNSEVLVKKLMAKVSENKFDIRPFLARSTLDMICETSTGVNVDSQNENNLPYFNALHGVIKMIMERHMTPWLRFEFIFRHSNVGKKFMEYVSTVQQFTNKIIQDRELSAEKEKNEIDSDKIINNSEGMKKDTDFLGLSRKALTPSELWESINGMIFAGHDTTYSALSWAVQLLGDHLDVQEKVHEELDRIFEGSDRPVNKEDLQEMKYLEQVIKETLRLYPSAPSVGRQLRNNIQIGGYTIPAGVSIWIHIYFLHRNPKYYPNPEEFNPDNFLPERIRQRHPYAFIPFSAGPRNCLGQKYAMMEMKTTLSYLLRRFKIKSLRKTKDLSPVYGITLEVHEGVHVSLELRENCLKRMKKVKVTVL